MQGVTERNRHNCKTDNEISGSEICDHQVENTQLRAGFTVLLVFIRKNGCLNVFLFRPIGSVRDLGPYLDRLKSKSLSAKRKWLCGRFYGAVAIMTADKGLYLKWVGLKLVGVFWA